MWETHGFRTKMTYKWWIFHIELLVYRMVSIPRGLKLATPRPFRRLEDRWCGNWRRKCHRIRHSHCMFWAGLSQPPQKKMCSTNLVRQNWSKLVIRKMRLRSGWPWMIDMLYSSFCNFAFEVFDPQPKSVLSVDFQERPAMCSSTNMSVLPNTSQPNSMETTGLMFRVRKCWRGLFHHQNVKNVFLVQTLIAYKDLDQIWFKKWTPPKYWANSPTKERDFRPTARWEIPKVAGYHLKSGPEPCPRHSMSIQSWWGPEYQAVLQAEKVWVSVWSKGHWVCSLFV